MDVSSHFHVVKETFLVRCWSTGPGKWQGSLIKDQCWEYIISLEVWQAAQTAVQGWDKPVQLGPEFTIKVSLAGCAAFYFDAPSSASLGFVHPMSLMMHKNVFAKLTSFLWKRHFCPGHDWMQSKIHLSWQSWNDCRCVFVSPGRVPYTDCMYQLVTSSESLGKIRKWHPPEDRMPGFACTRISQVQHKRVQCMFRPSWAKRFQRVLPLKGSAEKFLNILKMLKNAWKHICYYNLLNRW